jgi:hypothetical protein
MFRDRLPKLGPKRNRTLMSSHLTVKPKHIGIVACSTEGAALCFREIAAYSQKFMGEHMHPQVTLSCIARSMRLRYNEVIDRMKARGCDCVILGCTEIPLLVRPDDCPLPALDSTRLLARAAVDTALRSG